MYRSRIPREILVFAYLHSYACEECNLPATLISIKYGILPFYLVHFRVKVNLLSPSVFSCGFVFNRHIMYRSTHVYVKCLVSYLFFMAIQRVNGAWHAPALRRDGVVPERRQSCSTPSPNVDQNAVSLF